MKRELVKVGMVVKWAGRFYVVRRITPEAVEVSVDNDSVCAYWPRFSELRPLTARERGE